MMLAALLDKKTPQMPYMEVMLLLVAVVWGTSYGITKEALAYLSVLAFIAVRFFLTFVCLLPVLWREWQAKGSEHWRLGIPTGGVLAFIFLFEVLGVSLTTASNAAFLISLSLLFTVYAERLINKTPVDSGVKGLVLLSIVGVFCLTQSSTEEVALNTGDGFILIAAVLRALMVTTTKRLTKGKAVSNASLTCIQSAVVCLFALTALAFVPNQWPKTFPVASEFWLMIGYLVLFCTLFAFYVQNKAVRVLSPSKAALLMGSEPLFGALFAMFWLQESLALVQWLGCGLIMVSVLCVTRLSTQAHARQPRD